jgi:hypothetical protein
VPNSIIKYRKRHARSHIVSQVFLSLCHDGNITKITRKPIRAIIKIPFNFLFLPKKTKKYDVKKEKERRSEPES